MDIKNFLKDWLELSNNFNTEMYLDKYHDDAILDDPSVGKKFIGREGIRNYFVTYFIGYKTHTKLVQLDIVENMAHLKPTYRMSSGHSPLNIKSDSEADKD